MSISFLFKTESRFFLKALLSLFLLNGLTIGVLIFVSYGFTEESLTTQTEDRITQDLTHTIQDYQRDYIDQVNRTLINLENLSLMDEYLRGSSAEKLVISRQMERIFLEQQKDYPFFEDIRFVDDQEKSVFGIKKGKRNFDLDSDEKESLVETTLRKTLFAQLKETPILLSSGNMEWFMPLREMQVIGPEIDEEGHHFILVGFSKMDKDTGQFSGAIFIKINYQNLFLDFQNILVQEQNPIWLFDAKGEVIFRPKTDEKFILNPSEFLEEGFQPKVSLLSNDQGIIVYSDLSIGYRGKPLRLVFSIPKSLLIKDFEAANDFFKLIALISLVLSIVLSVFLSRYLSGSYEKLALAKKQLTTAHRLANLGHWELDVATSMVSLSENASIIFGRPLNQTLVSLKTFVSFAVKEDRRELMNTVQDAIHLKKAVKFEHYLTFGDSELRYVHQELELIEGSVLKVMGTVQDISDRRQAELRIRELAYRDNVTGLANRTYFNELAENAIQEAVTQQKKMAVMFLDLDHFKRINDTLGHDAGDELLRLVSAELRSCLRPSDAVSIEAKVNEKNREVARFGGDEFTVLLTNLSDQQSAINIAKRILLAFDKPFDVYSSSVKTGISVGISFYPEHGENLSSLLKHADSAMYQAKMNGRSQYAVYNQQQNEKLILKHKLEIDIQHALERDEFYLLYQPRFDVAKKKIVAYEALLRWEHPEFGLIRPDVFIPIAEETGVINPIGRWVMQTACLQLGQWKTDYADELGISINISPVQFNSSTIIDDISDIINDSKIDPTHIEFEVTEQALIGDTDLAIQVTKKIKQLGINLSIDDFGTGYSSLKQLRLLPVSLLKIDQSFSKNMLTNKDDAAIIYASIALAHSLGLKAVVEGVESIELASQLIEMGCDELQGYYFGEAQSVEQCTELLSSQLTLELWDK